jgi:hypothetical protein
VWPRVYGTVVAAGVLYILRAEHLESGLVGESANPTARLAGDRFGGVGGPSGLSIRGRTDLHEASDIAVCVNSETVDLD